MQAHDTLIVLGGIGCDGVISRESDIVVFSTANSKIRATRQLALTALGIDSQIPRPLLVGSSVVLTKNGNLVIVSGAATCFSMGTFCMSNPVSLPSPSQHPRSCRGIKSFSVIDDNRSVSGSAFTEGDTKLCSLLRRCMMFTPTGLTQATMSRRSALAGPASVSLSFLKKFAADLLLALRLAVFSCLLVTWFNYMPP